MRLAQSGVLLTFASATPRDTIMKAIRKQNGTKTAAGDTALLSSHADMTLFSYGGETIRFRTSPRLERYMAVKLWDKGYIVAMAKYKGIGEEEEYIDLVPVLRNLCIDADEFLRPIEKVRISYD